MPVVIIEVISESTRRVDEGEKRINYLSIPSLDTLVMLEQNCCAARVIQRTADGFTESIYSDIDSVVPLPAVRAQLALAEIYAGIEFPQPSPESEGE